MSNRVSVITIRRVKNRASIHHSEQGHQPFLPSVQSKNTREASTEHRRGCLAGRSASDPVLEEPRLRAHPAKSEVWIEGCGRLSEPSRGSGVAALPAAVSPKE